DLPSKLETDEEMGWLRRNDSYVPERRGPRPVLNDPLPISSDSEDEEVIRYMKTKSDKHVVVQIEECYGERQDMDCLFVEGEHVNGSVISLYIELMRHEEYGKYREGRNVYLENSWWSQILKANGEQDPEDLGIKRQAAVESRVKDYLKADMVFLPINIPLCHWYLAVVNTLKRKIQVLDSFGMEMMDSIGMQMIELENKKLDTSRWEHGIEVSSWETNHMIARRMQKDSCSCGLWMLNFMEYWTGTTLSDHVTQADIDNFRFKLPAILYNSPINEKRGKIDNDLQYETPNQQFDDVEELDEAQILYSGDPKMISTLRWASKEELLQAISTIIQFFANDKTLDKEWVRSTEPHPISLSHRNIINILQEGKELDHESFNMSIRMLVKNQGMKLRKQKYHIMDLKFAEITRFGRDPRCCGPVNKVYQEKLKKVLECWPDMQYHINDCTNILLPYYQDGLYILFIIDMQNKIVRIMDPLQEQTSLPGFSQDMAYTTTFQAIARMFMLAMGLSKSRRNHRISSWRREYPSCVTKVTSNHKDW
ncbi:hypothetical protein BDA96_02G240300, partial [Sorghum bicolor]